MIHLIEFISTVLTMCGALFVVSKGSHINFAGFLTLAVASALNLWLFCKIRMFWLMWAQVFFIAVNLLGMARIAEPSWPWLQNILKHIPI